MKAKISLLLILSLGMFAIGCGNIQAAEGASPDKPKATDFDAIDINGRAFKLSDYSGRVIILNFFTTWCPPCKAEMPDFNEIAKDYEGVVTVIAINVGNEPLSKVKDFVKRHNLEFTIALDDGKISKLYGPIRAIPVTVIIDKNFHIAGTHIGQRSKGVFVTNVKALLQ